MQLSVMLEPQEGLTYDEQLAVARRAEALGFAGFYRSDHYMSVTGRPGLNSTDACAALAGLARDTERIRLGALVSPVTFRPAGNLAKVAATVTEMAGTAEDGSRVVLGMGTGWLEEEHRAHGFPFEDLATRFRRLEEHLAAVRAFWDPDAGDVDLDGEFVQVRGGRFAPVPTRARRSWSAARVCAAAPTSPPATPTTSRQRLDALAGAGAEQVMLQLLLHDDLDQLDELAELLPR